MSADVLTQTRSLAFDTPKTDSSAGACESAGPGVEDVGGAMRNKLLPDDRAVHDWYRFVLSFPPHLVREYVERFNLNGTHTVLDPFCGTGTTLVECKKLGIGSVGLEPSPMAHFASAVKVDWSVDGEALGDYADAVAAISRQRLSEQGITEHAELPLFTGKQSLPHELCGLPEEQAKLLLTGSISPLPLHKALVLRQVIDERGSGALRRFARLGLAKALVRSIGNLRFGPEVGVGKPKADAPVVDAWHQCVISMARELDALSPTKAPACVLRADARDVGTVLAPETVDAVITSPPYPNEKDYTRTTRLESVILGLVRDRRELRALKQGLIRSNTRGVYKADTDDREVADDSDIAQVAKAIEQRRIELGKTSGFERLYSRVTLLYFGGMHRHLASLRSVLKPGAKLAYVVGDQASYLRIMIRTGELLAGLAQTLGYKLVGIDLFRTRRSTATGDDLREEVLLLEWPGGGAAYPRSS